MLLQSSPLYMNWAKATAPTPAATKAFMGAFNASPLEGLLVGLTIGVTTVLIKVVPMTVGRPTVTVVVTGTVTVAIWVVWALEDLVAATAKAETKMAAAENFMLVKGVGKARRK